MVRLSLLTLLVACTSDPATGLVVVDPLDTEPVGFTEASHRPGDGDYDVLMGDGEVPRLDIIMTADNHAILQDDIEDIVGVSGGGGGPGGGGPGGGGPGGGGGGGSTFSDETPVYVPVTLLHDGQTWPSVGFRYKGNSTLFGSVQSGVDKLPFRLEMDHFEDDLPELEDQRFHGFKDLKFSSGYNDPTQQRDKLASDTFRQAGVPAARGGFVKVYVDSGEGPVYWGLYTVFEDPCGELLDSWFGDDTGNCYKPDGDGAALQGFVAADMEKKTNEEEADFSDVSAFVTALNADRTDAAAWRASLEETFDVDGYLRYLALNNLIGNWDVYGQMTHNYYLYGDPADAGRLTWMPWDFNESYSDGQGQRAPVNVELSNIGAGWPLLEYVAADPVYRAQYEAEVAELRSSVFDAATQQAMIDANAARIADAIAEEQAPYKATTQDASSATATLRSYVVGR